MASALLDDLFNMDPNVKHLLSPSQEELVGLEEAISRVRSKYCLNPTDQKIVFEYASLMISHSRSSYISEGVRLMESLVYAMWMKHWGGTTHTELLDSTPEVRVVGPLASGVVDGEVKMVASAPPESEQECGAKGDESWSTADLFIHYYYLTIGWIKLRDYNKSLTCVNQMLQLHPDHPQGVALKHYIDSVTTQTLTATGLAGVGLIAAAAAVIGVLVRKS